jgi:hypothetical protein
MDILSDDVAGKRVATILLYLNGGWSDNIGIAVYSAMQHKHNQTVGREPHQRFGGQGLYPVAQPGFLWHM